MFDRNQRAWAAKLAERRNATGDQALGSRPAHGPRNGDLVITREVTTHRVRYTIGHLGQQPQLACDTRDKALKTAHTYAQGYDVEIWESHGGRFTSVARRGPGAR